jgi:uncharacterized protein YkwD
MLRLLRVFQQIAKLPIRNPSLLTSLAVTFSCLALIFLTIIPTISGLAKTDNAYDLIGAVNQLRQANGLPAYQVNGSLMAAAQAHSEYQASIGSITHTGAGGSNAKGRAIAAGYGDGATVYVSENIAGGNQMSYQQAVQMWQGDSLHLNTMLGGNYTDVGAGVAIAGDRVYFTLDVGYIAGSPGSGSPVTGSTSQPPAAAANPVQPVVTSTPGPDGSISHKVQSGQTLWAISAIYKVSLPEILAINGFTDNTLIFPGDEILIRSAKITATLDATSTSTTSKITPTPRPTRTIAPTIEIQSTELAMQAEQVSSQSNLNPQTAPNKKDPALFLIAALVLGGSILMVVGNILKKQQANEEDR